MEEYKCPKCETIFKPEIPLFNGTLVFKGPPNARRINKRRIKQIIEKCPNCEYKKNDKNTYYDNLEDAEKFKIVGEKVDDSSKDNFLEKLF